MRAPGPGVQLRRSSLGYGDDLGLVEQEQSWRASRRYAVNMLGSIEGEHCDVDYVLVPQNTDANGDIMGGRGTPEGVLRGSW